MTGPMARGGSPPSDDYDFDFVTIGDPGNRATLPEEGNPLFVDSHVPRGSVGYVYRMATTEVTVGQHFEFVQAYAPRYFELTGDTIASPDFTGFSISAGFSGTFIRPGISPDRPTTMSWEYAARYVNWLHNGKADSVEAFETGVYDTSTFTQNPDGTYNHQESHAPNARFWLPTRDEWIKAGYWDPEKNEGEGGYWLFPNSSDIESVPGLLPEEGGERNAGPAGSVFPLDAGSFDDVLSPWGLLDMAGGEAEWTETVAGDPERRVLLGSRWSQDSYQDEFFPLDIIGSGISRSALIGGNGLRIAAAVPSSTVLSTLMAGSLLFMRRRR